MSGLNNQTQSIEAQEQALLAQLEALKAKKAAVVELEDEYEHCLSVVRKTVQLMIDAQLDPRALAKDVSSLCLPISVTSNRSTSRKTSPDGSGSKYLPSNDPLSQKGRSWTLFDNIKAELGEVTSADVKQRAAVEMPNDSIQNILWHLSNWRKAQSMMVSGSNPEPTPEPSTPPAITPPALSQLELTEAETASIDKRIEAENKSKNTSKKRA